jgi:hypothetical protein
LDELKRLCHVSQGITLHANAEADCGVTILMSMHELCRLPSFCTLNVQVDMHGCNMHVDGKAGEPAYQQIVAACGPVPCKVRMSAPLKQNPLLMRAVLIEPGASLQQYC